jgi:hypothetical protein
MFSRACATRRRTLPTQVDAINKVLTLRMNQASVKRHVPHLIAHIRAGRLLG